MTEGTRSTGETEMTDNKEKPPAESPLIYKGSQKLNKRGDYTKSYAKEEEEEEKSKRIRNMQ
jgi:hypothetical protein